MHVNGTEVLRYENIQFSDNSSPGITRLQISGAIAQPDYEAGEHYRRFDAIMVTDNWQES
jgi:hypothetical protein